MTDTTESDHVGSDGTATAEAEGVTARYEETDAERLLTFSADGRTATVAQNREGYAMLKVRTGPDGDELERYYGFDMALDHAAELLGVAVHDLPVPDPAADMGM
ncbi:hypothetical protein SAMN04488066_101225 [Halorubrum aquaticum]|uniref:Uncharacterized protein n=1 Tax=Halorubrum aquaticum TaxID=387340 RepID=A0A1I2Z4T1_9EURY|nr:hypothetical protein [Halorubrum aquaticum]SFH32804.1 hypothetical protein SAMN04488066_101225 [Halorubrum aquaticum]